MQLTDAWAACSYSTAETQTLSTYREEVFVLV